MNSDITVCCVYWKGKFRGRENCYTPDWVARLKGMVARNLKARHRFVCLSNTDVPCEKIDLKYADTWIGWWSKMELFRPGLFIGRVLYLDLDLVITRSLMPFFELPDDFYMTKKIRGKGLIRPGEVGHIFNSATMTWKADGYSSRAVCGLFMSDPERYMKELRGDQDFFSKYFQSFNTFPYKWSTKLRFCPGKGEKPDSDAIIINCMPQKNHVAAQLFPWVKKIWAE